jgi:flagellar M-ring protein FliF
MDLLKQSTGQAREAFAAMPVPSRVISIMLIAAIVIGLAFLVRGSDSAGKQLLFGGRTLTEHELDAIEMAFSRAGLSDYHREGRRMEIPTATRAEYLAALTESSSLPITLRSHTKEAIESTNIFDSSELRDSREMVAKEQDLGIKISAFPDVQWASVEYDKGERRGFSTARPQSASVLVIPEGNLPLSRNRIKDIENLVRGSYAGLSNEDIVVIDTNSTSGSSLAEEDDPLLRKQREAEARIEQKVRSLLAGFPAKVAVSAEIDPTMDVQKAVLSYDAEPTHLLNRSTKTEIVNNRQPVRGVPGTATNAIGNRAVSLDEDLETSRTKEDTRETTGVAGQQYEASRMASLQVKSARVSVGLPTSYYEKLHATDFLKKNNDKTELDVPAMSDADLENLRSRTKKIIQSAVTVLLPEVEAGTDRFPLVEVWDYTDLPQAAPEKPEAAKLVLTWLAESWQRLALIGLAVLALLVARSAAKAGNEVAPPPEFVEGFGLEIPSPPAHEEEGDEEKDRMTITGSSLKEELLMLVEGNPEVAANVIRGWVGEAA